MLGSESDYLIKLKDIFVENNKDFNEQVNIRGAYRFYDLYMAAEKSHPVKDLDYLMHLYRYEIRMSRVMQQFLSRFELEFCANLAKKSSKYIKKIRGNYTFGNLCNDWYEDYDGSSDDIYAVKLLRDKLAHHEFLLALDKGWVIYAVSELSHTIIRHREQLFKRLNSCSNGLNILPTHTIIFRESTIQEKLDYISKKHKQYFKK